MSKELEALDRGILEFEKELFEYIFSILQYHLSYGIIKE